MSEVVPRRWRTATTLAALTLPLLTLVACWFGLWLALIGTSMFLEAPRPTERALGLVWAAAGAAPVVVLLVVPIARWHRTRSCPRALEATAVAVLCATGAQYAVLQLLAVLDSALG